MCLFPLVLWPLSFVIVCLVARIGNLWNHSPFLSPKKRAHSCTVAQKEMWFEEPQVKSASDVEKKKEAAYTTAKLVLVF